MQELTLSCGVIGTATTAAIATSFCGHHWPLMHSFAIQHCAANLIESQAATKQLELVRVSLDSMHAAHVRSVQPDSSNGQHDSKGHAVTTPEPLSAEASGHDRDVSRFQAAAMAVVATLYSMCRCLSAASDPLGSIPCTERLHGVHIDPYVTLRVTTADNESPGEDAGSVAGGATVMHRQGLQLLHLFGCGIGRQPSGKQTEQSHPTPLQQWTKLIESSTSLQEVCGGQMFPECVEAGLLRGIANHAVNMRSRKRPREGQHISSVAGPLLHTVCLRGTHEASGRVQSSDKHLNSVLECNRLKNLTFTDWCGCQPGEIYSPAIFFLEDSRRNLPRTHGADALEHFSAAAVALPGAVAVRFQQPVLTSCVVSISFYLLLQYQGRADVVLGVYVTYGGRGTPMVLQSSPQASVHMYQRERIQILPCTALFDTCKVCLQPSARKTVEHPECAVLLQ